MTSSFDAFSDIVPTIDENQLTVDPNSYLESSRCTYVVNEKFKLSSIKPFHKKIGWFFISNKKEVGLMHNGQVFFWTEKKKKNNLCIARS